MSIGTPITPVEQTRMSPASASRRPATCSAVAVVSAAPRAPVQALAEPELTMTARAAPGRPCSPATTSRDHTAGAAMNRLVVKTPAATSSGPSLTTRARSGLPEGLSPALMPAARKPLAAVTLTGRLLP